MLRLTNTQILDGIRRDATADYRRRIPSATQGSVAATARALFNFPAHRNEFINALVNKVGLTIFNSVQWENPLGIFKRGMLEYGSSIEEITVGLINATAYDHDEDSGEQEVFGRAPVNTSVQYHVVNREDKYKVTIEQPTLKRAFTSEYGLSEFVSQILGSPQTSDEWDEFLLMVSLFSEVERSSGFFKVHVDDVSASSSTAAQAKGLMRRVRETADNLTFISERYNPLGMPTAVKREDLVLFTTPEANAALDVEALAAAFHMEKTDVPGRTIVIPREHFRIPGAQALLTTEKFFVVADQLVETTQMPNPAGLYENYWLHHWQVMSASLAAPAVLFTTDEGTVIELADDPDVTAVSVIRVEDRDNASVTAVERGELYRVFTSVTTNPDDEGIDGVRFAVIGSTSDTTLITKNGVLHVGLDEVSQSIKVRATATDNYDDVYGEITLTVYGDRVIYLPPEVVTDNDGDGLGEVTPDAVVIHDTNKVTIPTVTGVQYRKQVTSGVTFTDAGDLVTVPSGNQLVVGDRIVFGTITSTTGITAGVEYFVKTKPSANTLTLAATEGGAVLPLTTNGSAASATFDVANGSTHTLSGSTVFTAIADPATQYELAPGATASWTLAP